MKDTISKSGLSHNFLLETLKYNPETGVFTKLKDSKYYKIGAEVGSKGSSGVMRVHLARKSYNASTLAIFYMTKVMPKYAGYHDCNPRNNAYENIFPSDKKITYSVNENGEHIVSPCSPGKKKNTRINFGLSTNLHKKDDITPKSIINLIDGRDLNLTNIARILNKPEEDVLDQLIKLKTNSFISVREDGENYFISAKGHAEIIRNGDFSTKKRLDIIFMRALPGNLTGDSCVGQFKMTEIMRKKQYQSWLTV